MLKTTDEAREYFKPLTYKHLTKENFRRLVAILEEHLGKWNRKVLEDRDKYGHDNKYYMSIHPHKIFSKYPGTRFVDSIYKEAFIIVKCDNFSIREGISFNKDGFIGFAGWSDSDNVRPFIDAFEEWVDILKCEVVKPKIDLDLCNEFLHNLKVNIGEKYYVDEFPQNPVPGQQCCNKGIPYMYDGTQWHSLENAETKLLQITEVLRNNGTIEDVKEIVYR